MIQTDKGSVTIRGSVLDISADLGVIILALADEGVLSYDDIRKIIDISENRRSESVDNLFADLGASLASKMLDKVMEGDDATECPHMFWMVEPSTHSEQS